MADDFDPLVPRPLDQPRPVPLDTDSDLSVLDGGKILAAPDDPADRTLERRVEVPAPVAVAVREVTVAEFERRTGRRGGPRGRPRLATWAGARLPTEDEWQVAALLAGFERLRPEVWNLTESEHRDGRTRFRMLKGGSAHRSEGSPWYFDGGVREPEFSAKYLVPELGLGRSTSVGFRLAWDLPEAESP
jgi:hypothetical protein